MPKLKCTLPNVSSEINGVKFVACADGSHVSEEISEERAADFLSINGYSLHTAGGTKPPVPVVPVGGAGSSGGSGQAGFTAEELADLERETAEREAAEKEELTRLRARGVELSIPHAETKGLKKLRVEVAAAEKAAEDAKIAESKANEGTQGA